MIQLCIGKQHLHTNRINQTKTVENKFTSEFIGTYIYIIYCQWLYKVIIIIYVVPHRHEKVPYNIIITKTRINKHNIIQ